MCPDEIKFILPYLARANETRDVSPVVSYFCILILTTRRVFCTEACTFTVPFPRKRGIRLAEANRAAII